MTISRFKAASMIIVVTIYEENRKTGRKELVVSHGVCTRTGNTIILPSEHPSKIGAKWSEEQREWILPA